MSQSGGTFLNRKTRARRAGSEQKFDPIEEDRLGYLSPPKIAVTNRRTTDTPDRSSLMVFSAPYTDWFSSRRDS